MIDYTEGYPYFLQEYGNVLWNLGPGDRPGQRLRCAR